MTRRPLPKLMRAAVDAAFGLVGFLAFAAIISGSPGGTLFDLLDVAPLAANSSVVILAAVFSLIVAFNLAFYRHLRRVYASPRRGAWRRS